MAYRQAQSCIVAAMERREWRGSVENGLCVAGVALLSNKGRMIEKTQKAGKGSPAGGRRATRQPTKARHVTNEGRAYQAGRPTAEELERRKARVMEVATELFIERGYAATSFIDIAKAAGVATRTLYQHFGDKEAVFEEVIFARDTTTNLHQPVADTQLNLFENLMNCAQYVYDVALQPRSADLMRLMIAESTRFPDLIRNVAMATFRRFRHATRRFFESLAGAGQIPEGDHAQSAELFIEFILGNLPIMLYTKWATEPPTTAMMQDRVALFLRGRFGDALAEKSGLTFPT